VSLYGNQSANRFCSVVKLLGINGSFQFGSNTLGNPVFLPYIEPLFAWANTQRLPTPTIGLRKSDHH
jgi:hypothetical protein